MKYFIIFILLPFQIFCERFYVADFEENISKKMYRIEVRDSVAKRLYIYKIPYESGFCPEKAFSIDVANIIFFYLPEKWVNDP